MIYFTVDREGLNNALTQSRYLILLMVINFILINSVYADNLGRIFTSAVERAKLEKIRYTKPKLNKVDVVEVEVSIEPLIVEKETIIRDSITLKGLVHRSGGKSTAWINESNSYEGDLESQFIQVPGSKIQPDQVTIIMPDDSTNVELKVGEAFTPEPIERDVVGTTVQGEGAMKVEDDKVMSGGL
jgi:hypothetical protein